MTTKYQVKIEPKLCKSCGLCVDLCPRGVLEAAPPVKKAQVAEPVKCTGCLLCQEICPDWAIDVLEGGASE